MPYQFIAHSGRLGRTCRVLYLADDPPARRRAQLVRYHYNLGGLALQLDNSIKVGDWIKVDDVNGRVTDTHFPGTDS